MALAQGVGDPVRADKRKHIHFARGEERGNNLIPFTINRIDNPGRERVPKELKKRLEKE